jgi:CRISPR-associated protein Cmr4
MMKSAMLGLLAETSIHPGEGRSTGFVDLPVAREAATDYPVLVGSSLKGALRDHCRTVNGDNENSLFGSPNAAGRLMISDGRLLLLPVRSLTGAYKWVTCPHLLERYQRDLRRCGLTPLPEVPAMRKSENGAIGRALGRGEGHIYLEEREFALAGEPPVTVLEAVAPLLLHEETKSRLAEQLVVLSDDDFSWFARYGLAVQARNKLEERTKKSVEIWYEESLPSDTVMYALVTGRSEEDLDCLVRLFSPDCPYLQAGGNETVGQGWFAISVRTSVKGGAA